MNAALTGGLIGIAIAVVLFFFEYSAVNNAAKERTKKKASKIVVLESSERARLQNLGRFCVLLPFLCAGLGWLLL